MMGAVTLNCPQMKTKTLIGCVIGLVALGAVSPVEAQPHLMEGDGRVVHADIDPRYRLAEADNLWLDTANPSAVGVRTMPDIGTAQFAADHQAGDFHRAMESGVMNGWGFGADSYQSLKNINLWGDFSFAERHHRGRRWSDNFLPYNGNPYQSGSSVVGGYVEQVFDFGVKLSSKRVLRRMWFGMGVDYSLGDFSRINDPRSRVQFIDLSVGPGWIVEVAPRHRLGLNLTYRYRKEKNNRYVVKSTTSEDFLIYRQEGLGVYSTILSDNFDRRNKGNHYGGDLQYEFGGDGFSLMTSAGYMHLKDAIEDRMKESPGDYAERLVHLDLTARWCKPQSIHHARLKFENRAGEADKAFQELVYEEDPQTGVPTSSYVTLFSSKAFTHDVVSLKGEWRYERLRRTDCLWFVGARLQWWNMKDKYVFYVPSSKMEVASLSIGAEGGALLFSKGRHRLFSEFGAGFHLNVDGRYFISPDVDKQDIRRNVNDTDYEILSANALDMELRLKYIFPLARRYDGFVSLEGRNIVCVDHTSLRRSAAGIAIGILRRF